MSKRKLLLADDSITIQKVVNLTFADEGIEVIPVGDGDSAMRKFDEFMPDLVMADVNMPGLTGYEICRIIKQTDETRHIPVILLVGSFEPFDEEQAKNAGADDFLTKPFQSIRQLVNKVTDLLNQKETVAEETPADAPRAAPPTGSFADTLEFQQKDEEAVTEFGDAGMDDDMIETSPVNDFGADSESAYQGETTIDYAKTQPLNADDLKSFNIIPNGATPEADSTETFEDQAGSAENGGETFERAEAATFEEEAEKLRDTSTGEEPENIAQTEPQIDYYLPENDAEFEKELTDAETLAPEVSYSNEDARSAYFSEATTGEKSETEPLSEETSETGIVEETPEAETNFAEEPPTAKTSEESEPDTEKSEETEETAESEIDLIETVETEETPASESIEDSHEESKNPVSETLSTLNFDDGDLLELPPLVEETGIRPQAPVQQPKSEPEPVAETVEETVAETVETQAPAESETLRSFPPELIEAIAQRVAEKISAATMNDVLPQITELVMKQMAEKKKE